MLPHSPLCNTPEEVDSSSHAWHDIESPTAIDRLLHAMLGRFTFDISPVALTLAYTDWALHLAVSPGKWQRLLEKAVRKEIRLLDYAVHLGSARECSPCIEPLPQDRRFRDPAWQRWPFNLIHQGFLLHQQWWHNATTGIGGVSPHHEQVVSFMARQLLDIFSPVNFIFTNPIVLNATIQEGGKNLWRGMTNFVDDNAHTIENRLPPGTENFRPGDHVAVTPGEVIYHNRLIELIQYAPKTTEVHREPVLIVPAPIMKYYILDLSPSNSLVNYLVERGHTVFILSWHNPGEEDRDLGMEDYVQLGVFAAIDAVRAILPQCKINAVGYCLGGTLLTMAAAFLALSDDDRLHSLTLLATQADFTEPGELSLFIDDSQLDYLDDMMWKQGYLDTRQMASAFRLLRSNDLIWSLIVNDYLMGKRTPMTDLMAWNADATRMPHRMHSEYLRHLFLNNDLFAGRLKVKGKPVALSDIRLPIFSVATESDHVAPWRSVYKIHLASDTDITFVLTNGGHNAGIISEPGHRNRRFRLGHQRQDKKYIDPDNWYCATPPVEGSWWTAWSQWLEEHSSGRIAPPPSGNRDRGYPPLGKAPGTYVHER